MQLQSSNSKRSTRSFPLNFFFPLHAPQMEFVRSALGDTCYTNYFVESNFAGSLKLSFDIFASLITLPISFNKMPLASNSSLARFLGTFIHLHSSISKVISLVTNGSLSWGIVAGAMMVKVPQIKNMIDTRMWCIKTLTLS